LTARLSCCIIETEWTLNRSSPKSSGWKASSQNRTLDRSAEAILRLRIGGTTKCSRIARGFSFGSDTVSVAEPHPRWSGLTELNQQDEKELVDQGVSR
jgi:hypothetical protein